MATTEQPKATKTGDEKALPADLQLHVTRAMNASARAALMRHKREGHPIWIWRDGEVVSVPPEEIVIPPEE